MYTTATTMHATAMHVVTTYLWRKGGRGLAPPPVQQLSPDRLLIRCFTPAVQRTHQRVKVTATAGGPPCTRITQA